MRGDKLFLALFGFIATILTVCGINSCTKDKLADNTAAAENIEIRIDELIGQMTLEEKIGQMSQVRHFADIAPGDITKKYIGSVIHTDGPVPGKTALEWQYKFRQLQEEALSTRLAIPLLFGVDAIHGQNTFDGATIFPHNIGMGATYNPELVEKSAQITALETRALGLNWTFSPCIAIPYNERWGRVYEGFSESTDLTVAMTKACVHGYQGKFESNNILATAKHYIADGATDYGVEGGTFSLNEKEIVNRLLPPYAEAVNSNIGAIMVGFNSYEGLPLHAHKRLITDVLKDSLGFKGMVISDWKGYSRFGGDDIINAGVDMVMAVDGDLDLFQFGVKKAVEDGRISIKRINDAVKRILRQKFRLNLFENPFPDPELTDQLGSDQHRDVARQAVRESLVLLKNDNKCLPLAKEGKRILVVGEHANNTGLQSGGWTISWQGREDSYKGGTTILEGIKKLAPENEVIFDENGASAMEADVAIVVVGETPYAEFFGDINNDSSKYQLTLSAEHQKYINNIRKRVDNLVVILLSGRALVVTDQIDQSDAFIAAWLPGSEGDGIAEVLFGNYNFSGKLPHSWPRSVRDFDGKFGPNYWDENYNPLFELGYGLKY